MQALGINKQQLYYALFVSSEDVTSEGYKTGGKRKTYGTPVEMWANVSPSSRSADFEPFGNELDYERVMVTADMSCPIDENTVLWIGADPDTDKYNYKVLRVAKSLNSIAYALKEVTKS